jgi:hypothetical protein
MKSCECVKPPLPLHFARQRDDRPACGRNPPRKPQLQEGKENLVTNQSNPIGPKTPAAILPSDRNKPQPIRYWQQLYELYLDSIGRKETRKRYARALERFLGRYPDMVYGYQFLRPLINDYVQSRLADGAVVATVRLEMSAVRGLFQFAMDMGASDVMFNPANNVKVRKAKSGVQSGVQEQFS